MRASGRFPVAVDATDDAMLTLTRGERACCRSRKISLQFSNGRETNKERQNRHCGPYGAQ
jgi:hypothetical protein